jgi:outer membrane protein assembly factor BamE
MMFRKLLPLAPICLLVLSACARYDGDFKLPGVYRVEVQQGNILQQEMFDRLKAGMNKNQVRFILGTPAINDSFHPDRWDYVYTKSINGGRRQQTHITLYFNEDKLAYLEGDVVSSLRRPSDDLRQPSKIVDVPQGKGPRKGLMERIINSLPMIGDEAPQKRMPKKTAPTADPGDDS